MMESDSRVIEGRARDIIICVKEYFEYERENCKGLLQALNQILRIQNESKKVSVSLDLLTKVASYLKTTTRVCSRVTAATNVNKNTLTRILREGEQAKLNKTRLHTPVKRPRGKKKFFDSASLEKLKILINDKKCVKLKKLEAIAKEELHYTGSQSTLRRIFLDLGWQGSKRDGDIKTMGLNIVKLKKNEEKLEKSNQASMEFKKSETEITDDKKESLTDNEFADEEVLEEYLSFDELSSGQSDNGNDY